MTYFLHERTYLVAMRGVQERFARAVFGRKLSTEDITHQTASNPTALAVLASDALSSVSCTVDVDPKRTAAFRARSAAIAALNGWSPDVFQGVDEPYRDLFSSVAGVLRQMRAAHPNVSFEVYIGALRTCFPFSLLHISTDHFLRDALVEVEDVALNLRQLDLGSIPLPPGFHLPFEHATDSHHHLEEGTPSAAHRG